MTIVRFTGPAKLELHNALAWWLTNRDKNPFLLREELAAALVLLRSVPQAGTPYQHGTRRRLLPRTGCFLYYCYHAAADVVTIHAVQSGRRRRAPRRR